MKRESGGRRARPSAASKWVWLIPAVLLAALMAYGLLGLPPEAPAGQGIVPQERFLDVSGDFYTYEDPAGGVTARLGVDVSSYQGEIDWGAVKAAGVEFAMLRVGFRGYETGALVEDAAFRQNAAGAAAAGLDVGVYFYSQALTEKEAQEEARFVLDAVKEVPITGLVAYDLEFYTAADARTDQLDGRQATLNAAAFCQAIQAAGYAPAVYTNGHWADSMYDLDALDQWPIWYAGYGAPPALERGVVLWQYTESGTVPGIAGAVDLDLWFQQAA